MANSRSQFRCYPRFKVERLCNKNISGSPKSSFHKRPYKPGPQGKSLRKKRPSEFSLQRTELRTLAAYYGSDLGHKLRFNKILRYARETLKKAGQDMLQSFIQNFERRLDTVVFRLKWAPSMRAARQMLSHGKCIRLNGKKATRGHISPGQVISLTEEGIKSSNFALGQVLPYNEVPQYLALDGEHQATMTHLPTLGEVSYPCKLDAAQVLKFCRRYT